MTAVQLPETLYDRCPDCSAPTALVATGPSVSVRLDIEPDPAGRYIVLQDPSTRGAHLAVQLGADTAAAVAAYRHPAGAVQPLYTDHRRPGGCPFARPRRPSEVRADLAATVCRRACGHHHDGPPDDPGPHTGPPCDGCRWCQLAAPAEPALFDVDP